MGEVRIAGTGKTCEYRSFKFLPIFLSNICPLFSSPSLSCVFAAAAAKNASVELQEEYTVYSIVPFHGNQLCLLSYFAWSTLKGQYSFYPKVLKYWDT